MVRGTAGYERFVDHFIASSQALDFKEVCYDFLEFLPEAPANILDAGAGAGQNAMALAEMGHTVVAVEPMIEFLNAARDRYVHPLITWQHDSLPTLKCLADDNAQFDFILVDGVWHHLDDAEREAAWQRLAQLLKTGRRCALSLRNGPAGMGTHVFATDAEQTMLQAESVGLKCVMLLKNQPSMFSFKPDVIWSRLVFEKAPISLGNQRLGFVFADHGAIFFNGDQSLFINHRFIRR